MPFFSSLLSYQLIFHHDQTSKPSGSNNTLIFAALGAAALGAGGYYFYGTDATPAERVEEIKTVGREVERVAEAKTGLGLKKKEDYQKVYNRIAETLEQDEYDGAFVVVS